MDVVRLPSLRSLYGKRKGNEQKVMIHMLTGLIVPLRLNGRLNGWETVFWVWYIISKVTLF